MHGGWCIKAMNSEEKDSETKIQWPSHLPTASCMNGHRSLCLPHHLLFTRLIGHSFIQPICTEYLLRSKRFSKAWMKQNSCPGSMTNYSSTCLFTLYTQAKKKKRHCFMILNLIITGSFHPTRLVKILILGIFRDLSQNLLGSYKHL